MRQADLTRLMEPYDKDAAAPGPGPGRVLEADLPSCDLLLDEMHADLRATAPFGIGWWAPDPGTSRRILISDQLMVSAQSVSANLVEARLHLLEFFEWIDRESDRLADAVRLEQGKAIIHLPMAQTPWEELGPAYVRLHVTGVARALAGALDCLGGVMIGVLALPVSILQTDFAHARESIRGVQPSDQGAWEVLSDFARSLEHRISGAGPRGWLEWLLAFRHMLVHRGRRTEIGQVVPRAPILFGPDERPIPRARVVYQLPSDPQRSDIEVLVDPDGTPILTEDAEHTLLGLFGSVRMLLESTAAGLLDVWRWRRAHPRSLPQPAAQWPHGAATGSLAFGGYAAGTVPYTPSAFLAHPLAAHRMRAGALDDDARARWRTFD